MKLKVYSPLLVVLVILLAVSIFLNGWLLYERSETSSPENYLPIPTPDCKSSSECPGNKICCQLHTVPPIAVCMSPDRCSEEDIR